MDQHRTALLSSLVVTGQADYSTIDARSKDIPGTHKTCAEITRYLTENLATDMDRARAIYTWIAHNIAYDIKLGPYYLTDDLVEKTLDRRKGKCGHYAELFSAMASLA